MPVPVLERGRRARGAGRIAHQRHRRFRAGRRVPRRAARVAGAVPAGCGNGQSGSRGSGHRIGNGAVPARGTARATRAVRCSGRNRMGPAETEPQRAGVGDMNTWLVNATGVLAVGTFALRVAGPALRSRITLSARVQYLMTLATVVLLAALVVTSGLLEGGEFVGPARPAGVLVGGVLAWRRAPFVVVVLAAAAVAAGLRLLGVP